VLTNYFIVNLLHHYLLLPNALPLPTVLLTYSRTKFPNFVSLSPAILLLHPPLSPSIQLNLPIFLLSGPHTNLKFLWLLSIIVLTSSLNLIRSSRGFWGHVLQSLLLPSPTMSNSIRLLPLISSILFSENMLHQLEQIVYINHGTMVTKPVTIWIHCCSRCSGKAVLLSKTRLC